jgi:hypothetical protein
LGDGRAAVCVEIPIKGLTPFTGGLPLSAVARSPLIGNVAALDDAVAAFNATERIKGKTIIRVRPLQHLLPIDE